MKKTTWGLLLLTIGLLRCSAPELRSLDFVEVTVLPPQFVNFNQAELQGQVLDLEIFRVFEGVRIVSKTEVRILYCNYDCNTTRKVILIMRYLVLYLRIYI